MTIHCDVFVRWSSEPEQFRALGSALWRWNIRAAGKNSIYQYLDNQALADLIAGHCPVSSGIAGQMDQGCHFRIRDDVSHDRLETIQRLRREIPDEGIEDILVDGTSWNVSDQQTSTEK